MPESQAPSMPSMDIRSPSITVNESNREGIIQVMFKTDPKILDWIFNTFDDSHIEIKDGGGIESVPNADQYECTKCHKIKTRSMAITQRSYLMCSGTEHKKHPSANTKPLGWAPILKQKGLYYVMGQVNSTLNTNIATGNLSATEMDIKNKMTLQDRLNYEGWYISYSTLAVIVGQYKRYVAEWVIDEKALHSVFNVGFCTNFLINMTKNIVSNSTKGKGMDAAKYTMDTHVSTESNTQHNVSYDYPASMAINNKKNLSDRVSDIFNFGNKN